MTDLIRSIDVLEDTGELLLGRVVYASGNATILNTSTITYKCYNADTGVAVITNGTLTPSDVMFATLQTGDEWDEDDTGYNVAWDAPGSLWPDEGRYQLEVTFTPTSGLARVLVWEAKAKALFGS